MGGVLAKIVFKNKEENITSPTGNVWEIKQKDIDGNTTILEDFLAASTKCILVVNVATK